MSGANEEITKLLQRAAAGEEAAEADLFEALYGQLRGIARGLLANERPGHSLQPTALVHEVFLRLRGGSIDWQNRTHFFSVAARVMRRILVDHARARLAKKRPGSAQRVEADETLRYSADDPVMVLMVDEALQRLAALDERQARVVEMRFFGGLTEDEIAEVLGISTRTAKREWKFARLWLFSQLKASQPPERRKAT